MNKSLAAGAGLLIVGFLMFQFGLAEVLKLEIFPGIDSIFSLITPSGLLIVETVGGIIAIIGLLSCFTSITHDRRTGSRNTQQYLSQLSSNLSTLEKKIDNAVSQLSILNLSLKVERTAIPSPQPAAQVKAVTSKEAGQSCKFCNTKILQGIIFCPSCGRSQV